MKKLAILILTTLPFTSFSQDLTFDETVDYLVKNFEGLKSTQYGGMVHSLDFDGNCKFTLFTTFKEENVKHSNSFDLSILSSIEAVDNGIFIDSSSESISWENLSTGSTRNDESLFIYIDDNVTISRLTKAFNHAKSLCKDPFDD